MIETIMNSSAGKILEHPLVAVTGGTSMIVVGVMNKIAESQPFIHDVLSDVSMVIGIVVALIGCAVQVRVWRIRGEEHELVRIEKEQAKHQLSIIENTLRGTPNENI